MSVGEFFVLQFDCLFFFDLCFCSSQDFSSFELSVETSD